MKFGLQTRKLFTLKRDHLKSRVSPLPTTQWSYTECGGRIKTLWVHLAEYHLFCVWSEILPLSFSYSQMPAQSVPSWLSGSSGWQLLLVYDHRPLHTRSTLHFHSFPPALTNSAIAVTPTDRPKSVCNRCVIEVFGGVFCVVTLLLGFFRRWRGFWCKTESDLFFFC